MKISRQNYENYMIDYIEGRLNYLEHESIRIFLINNPDIAEEIEGFKEINISENELTVVNRTTLYKTFSLIAEINEKNFEEFCVAFLEGDLDVTTKSRLLNYIGEDKEKERIFKLYQSLIFKADNNIRYQSKKSLKKLSFPIYRKYVFYAASIAAAVLLAIILKLNNNQQGVNNITNENALAHNDKAVVVSHNKSSEDIKIQKYDSDRIRSNYQEIAAVDTNNQNRTDYIQLTSITPMEAEISVTAKEDQITIHSNDLLSQNDIPKNSETENIIALHNQSQKSNKQGDNIFIKVLKLGIKGISDLTESNIALSTQTDDEGNLTAFAISAGEFEISRKVNSKSQKN